MIVISYYIVININGMCTKGEQLDPSPTALL